MTMTQEQARSVVKAELSRRLKGLPPLVPRGTSRNPVGLVEPNLDHPKGEIKLPKPHLSDPPKAPFK